MSLFKRIKNVSRSKRSQRRSRCHYGVLEPRMLLAGISFDSATGEVLVVGTNNDDTVLVTPQNNQVTVSLGNIEQQTFDASSVSAVRFRGLNGNDTFVNNSNLDSFAYGHAGNDVFTGGGGNDRFQGGAGNDTLNGMGANDLLQGNDGDDTILGGDQHDRVRGGAGNDIIKGEAGRDHLSGNDGDDRIEGNDGKDRLFGLDGNDILIGGNDSDRIDGGLGNDDIQGGNGYDRLFGQEDDDTIRGGNGKDKIYGEDGDDTIFGNAGNDLIFGGGGEDTIRGDGGDDQINLGSSGDTAVFTANMSNYSSSQTGSTIVINDNRTGGGDGRDTLTSVEQLRFLDGDRTPNQLPANLNAAEQESLRLLNQLRSGLGRGVLTAATDISQYARDWSEEMSRTGFRHSPSASLLEFLGDGRTLIGENIVFYSDTSLSATQAAAFFHEQWTESPGHYDNMINGEFTEVGIGLYRAANGWWGTHVFTNG